MRDNLRVYRIAWSKIAGNRVDWRKLLLLLLLLSLLFFLLLLFLRWRRCLICETSRSRKDAASSVPALPLPFDIDSFFRRSPPTAPVSRYMNEGGLKREASLGTKTKLRRPSRRPRAEIEKNRNYTRRERKPARSRRIPMRFNPLRREYDPRPSSILLRPSTDVIGATKEILRAQIGGS